jgi:maltose-binding protein MalE
MTMKRLFAAFLISILILGTAAAQTRPLRVIDPFAVLDAYLETYPDRSVDALALEHAENGQSNAKQLLLDDPDGWDVAFLWSNDVSLAALDDTGLLLDLKQEADLAERADDLYPAVQSAVTIDGRLAAMPIWMTGAVQKLTMLTVDTIEKNGLSDILTPLGVNDENRPQTFAELCELGERYMALSAETRRGTAFNAGAISGNPTAYFLNWMIELYTAQYCGADGTVAYDTDAFRKAVADVDALAGALSSDPKLLYRKDGSTTIYSMVSDSGSALISSYGEPLYLGIGNNTVFPTRLKMAVVNVHSDQQAEALDFVRYAIQNFRTESDVMLLVHPDYEALARQSYDETIAGQIAQHEDQSVIDALIAERDAGDYPRFYSREAIAFYSQTVAPRLTFPRIPRFDAYKIAKAYATGKLDVDGLIAVLTETVQNAMN